MSRLVAEMQAAWTARGHAALEVVLAAEAAPALFKPEAVAQANADVDHAALNYVRWSA